MVFLALQEVVKHFFFNNLIFFTSLLELTAEIIGILHYFNSHVNLLANIQIQIVYYFGNVYFSAVSVGVNINGVIENRQRGSVRTKN